MAKIKSKSEMTPPPSKSSNPFVAQFGPKGLTPLVHPASWGRDVKALSSGLLTFDVLSGRGGFPQGTVNSVSGASKTGKSTLMYRTSAEAIAKRMETDGEEWMVLYNDTERGYGPAIAEANGLDMEYDVPDDERRFWLTQYEPVDIDDEDAETRIEGTLKDIRIATKLFMKTAHQMGRHPLVIVDSLNFATPIRVEAKKAKQGEEQKASDNKGGLAVAARTVNDWMPELLALCGKYQGIAIFVVQFRANIATGPGAANGPQYRVSEPFAMKYGPSIKAKFVYVGKVDATEEQEKQGFERAGDNIQITIEKNRGGINYRQGVYRLLADRGPDDIFEVIFYGQMTGFVQKGGAFYKFLINGEWTKSQQGMANCWDYFYESEERLMQLAVLKQQIREKLLMMPSARAVGKGDDQPVYVEQEEPIASDNAGTSEPEEERQPE